jgi:uncharacterized protein (TIGR04551 family)
MSRLTLPAALAALLLAAGVRADEPKKESAPVDPKVEALIKQAVEKAKQEMREELRADLQGTQAAAEFSAAAAPSPKLQFFELDGYFRVRGDLKDSYDFHRMPDKAGNYIYPGPVLPGTASTTDPRSRSTMTGANMRLRLAPTLNVSESVRVRAQADLFDNYVLGARPAATPSSITGAVITDRPVVNLKMAWAEVETPVGLLSFGRMPSVWGLGIVHPSQEGLDDDFGDVVDRIQFASFPVPMLLGGLTFIPYVDFFASGPIQGDPRYSKSSIFPGAGQPFSVDTSGNGRTYGLKAAKLDTADELRRKLERGESSFNYGAFYEYTTLATVFPETANAYTTTVAAANTAIARGQYDHQLDAWARWRTPRAAVEFEGTYVYGHVNNPSLPQTAAGNEIPPVWTGPAITMNQFGLALRATYQVTPNRVTMGAELAMASGDSAPGFGNQPWLANDPTKPVTYGVFEGAQYNLTTGDHTINNFRFNPGYRPDLIFWRDIMGQVTDAWYFKPTLHIEIVSAWSLDAWLVYSQSMFRSSTPNSVAGSRGQLPLGMEADAKLSLNTDEGFSAWLASGVFQPLTAFDGGGALARAWTIKFGLAARF